MTQAGSSFDEMFAPDGTVRPAYGGYREWYEAQDQALLRRKGAEAEGFFRSTGITFNVYGDDAGEERLIPFDMVPRIVTAREWRRLSRGIEQRVRALNAFLRDIYHRQEIIRAGQVPLRLIAENDAFLAQAGRTGPPGGIYTRIVGIDLVRTGPDDFMVLEDNAPHAQRRFLCRRSRNHDGDVPRSCSTSFRCARCRTITAPLMGSSGLRARFTPGRARWSRC
ncbi:MAG: circularly permuted type 2 ATP-grasp protein [Novosphingobium sp.]